MSADRIEAAARVLFARSNYGNGLTWDDTDSLGHDSYTAWARAVLTAADTVDQAPTFEQLLRDPTEQFDRNSELLPAIVTYIGGLPESSAAALMRFVEEYRNAPSNTASAPRLAAGAAVPGEQTHG